MKEEWNDTILAGVISEYPALDVILETVKQPSNSSTQSADFRCSECGNKNLTGLAISVTNEGKTMSVWITGRCPESKRWQTLRITGVNTDA